MAPRSRFNFASRCRFNIDRVIAKVALAIVVLLPTWSLAASEATNLTLQACVTDEHDLAALNNDGSTEVSAQQNLSDVASRMLANKNFTGLDCVANVFRTNKTKFSGGLFKLHNFYLGLMAPPLHPTENDWTEHMRLVHEWVAAKPRSITARVALARSYVEWAQSARGDGEADTVSASGWKLYNERSREAKRVLDEASELPTKCPEWYVMMEQVVRNIDWDSAAKRGLFDQAIKFAPDFYYYYRVYAEDLLPQWSGSPGEAEAFVREQADRVGGDAGDIVYFQTASYLVCGCASDRQEKFSWARIQKGFAALEKQSGPSPENWNLFARLAMSNADAVVADQMFSRLGDQWSQHVWTQHSYYDSARQWAKQMAPIMRKKTDEEDAAAANLKTVEGQHYNVAFAEKIQGWIQACTQEIGSGDVSDFELLVKIGKEGTVDDMNGATRPSALTTCLGHKIMEFRVSKQAVFAPPPSADYWLRFDFTAPHATDASLK